MSKWYIYLNIIKGNTPLHMAFKSKNIGIIVELIQNDGDLNVLNNDGNTPIAYGSDDILAKLNLNGQVAAVKQKGTQFDNNLGYNRRYTTEINDPIDGRNGF